MLLILSFNVVTRHSQFIQRFVQDRDYPMRTSSIHLSQSTVGVKCFILLGRKTEDSEDEDMETQSVTSQPSTTGTHSGEEGVLFVTRETLCNRFILCWRKLDYFLFFDDWFMFCS